MEVNPATGASDVLNIAGNAGLNGTLNLVKLGDGEFAVGNIFTLFDAQEGISGNLTLPALPAGMKWDKSMLYSSGSLAIVADASGFDNISAEKEIKSVEYFDILGRKIDEYTKGIVIQKITYTDGSIEVKKNFVRENYNNINH